MQEQMLIRKLGSFKARLNVFNKYLRSLKSPLMAWDSRQLKIRLSNVKPLLGRYQDVMLQLKENVKLPMDLAEFESMYFASLTHADELLNKYHDTEHQINAPRRDLYQLPPIELPKFNGDHNKWEEFREIYVKLIHSNKRMQNIHKFHYLKACLEGYAAGVIQSINYVAKNYERAWNTLCEKFADKKSLVEDHLSDLVNYEAMTQESSVKLKQLIDVITTRMQLLGTLDENAKHWTTFLIYMIIPKFDPVTRRKWDEFKGRFDDYSKITYELFMEFLRGRADALQSAEAAQSDVAVVADADAAPQDAAPQDADISSLPRSYSRRVETIRQCLDLLNISEESRKVLLAGYKIRLKRFRAGTLTNICKLPGCHVCKRRRNPPRAVR